MGVLAVPTSPYFHVGNTNILWVSRFWWCRHIQIDFHTFHFSFLLTFCTCFFFPFLLTFCTCFFPFLLTFCFLQPTIYCLFTFLTYMFNTFATTTWLLKPLSVLWDSMFPLRENHDAWLIFQYLAYISDHNTFFNLVVHRCIIFHKLALRHPHTGCFLLSVDLLARVSLIC